MSVPVPDSVHSMFGHCPIGDVQTEDTSYLSRFDDDLVAP